MKTGDQVFVVSYDVHYNNNRIRISVNRQVVVAASDTHVSVQTWLGVKVVDQKQVFASRQEALQHLAKLSAEKCWGRSRFSIAVDGDC